MARQSEHIQWICENGRNVCIFLIIFLINYCFYCDYCFFLWFYFVCLFGGLTGENRGNMIKKGFYFIVVCFSFISILKYKSTISISFIFLSLFDTMDGFLFVYSVYYFIHFFLFLINTTNLYLIFF